MSSQQGIEQPQAAVPAPSGLASARRTLAVAGTAHALHDGYTDLIYVLLPVWQTEFGLGFAMLAMLRALYAGTMAALQVPSGWLVRKLDGRIVLAIGTALAAAGYAFAGFTRQLDRSVRSTCDIGCRIEHAASHRISSGLASIRRIVARPARHLQLHGGPRESRDPSSDVAASDPDAMARRALAARGTWRRRGGCGLPVHAANCPGCPSQPLSRRVGRGRGGFPLLFAIGMLDTGVRMGLLTFLPFPLKAKDASLPTVGIALAMVFLGGAAGKFVCGWLGARVGVLLTVLATEGGTAACIIGVLVLPLAPLFVLLPVLGVMLNGTSSVLYGTVPDLTPPEKAEHAFALFYTGTIGSGAISPILYGVLGDWVGPNWATVATAIVALAIFPLGFALAPHLADTGGNERSQPDGTRQKSSVAST